MVSILYNATGNKKKNKKKKKLASGRKGSPSRGKSINDNMIGKDSVKN